MKRFELTADSRFRSIVRLGLSLAAAVLLGCGGEEPQRVEIAAAASGGEPVSLEAGAILERTGITRGLCAAAGDGALNLALELAKASELLIHVQLENAEDVEQARRAADEAGLLGTRVYVVEGSPGRLHLAANLADVLVVAGGAAVPDTEALRVLRPGGTAFFESRELVKPALAGADDWSHPYHGPDNNPQSNDTVARAPYLTQFLTDPRYAPLCQVAVASAGRVFKAFGHVAFKTREEPWLNTLAAFNGYNGTLLWTRDLVPGIMVHRNNIIATPDIIYLGENESCKLIDAATGEFRDEIRLPAGAFGGTFWKWMALEDGVLYAVVGDDEHRDKVERHNRTEHGWPWDKISEGFNMPENPWGLGRTVLAVDPSTKKVLWSRGGDTPIDTRAVCMRGGRIYLYSPGVFLACLDAATGKDLWRRTPGDAGRGIGPGVKGPDLFAALGPALGRQGWNTNWRTTCYLKCSDDALYFAGPQVGKLLAVSTADGRVLWENAYDNFQLVLRDDGLYGISGPWGVKESRRFDPLTGEVLASLNIGRRACSRPSGSADAIFFRAAGGSVRLDLATERPQWISPMRAQCHDGVTIANGLLYWWPSVCDCNLTLYGVTCLGPAGDFDFAAKISGENRLEVRKTDVQEVARLDATPADWPSFRANSACTAATDAVVPQSAGLLWTSPPAGKGTPTAPTAAGGLVFLGGSDGRVRCLDAATGNEEWSAFTGGGLRIPPSVWNGRALAGSGDGWIYCFEARTGRRLWRFRAAPEERTIPVYGELLSTWPVASGVTVADGVAYAAAGIANYDGTHVFALDAATGEQLWHNGSSGHLDAAARCGVCVQGHLLVHGERLYLAGGTAVSPAVYDRADGKCLNDSAQLAECMALGSRGWELYLVGDEVVACGRPYYAHPEHQVYDADVFCKLLIAPAGKYDAVLVNARTLLCYPRIDRGLLSGCVAKRDEQSWFSYNWGLFEIAGLEPRWRHDLGEAMALAVGANAAVAACAGKVTAFDLETGKVLWERPLSASPVPWGLCLDRGGRVVVTLTNGETVCFGGGGA